MCTVLRLKSASKEKSQVLQIVHNPPAASCDRPSAILVSLFEMGFPVSKNSSSKGSSWIPRVVLDCLFCYSHIKWRSRRSLMTDLSVCTQWLSRVQLPATPWTAAHQAPLSVGFPRQEYWSMLSFLPPGDLPDLGMKPPSPVSPTLAGGSWTTEPPRKS